MAQSSTLRIAWRNLGRNRKRSLLAFGAIAFGQFAFLAVAALVGGYGDQFLNSVTGPLLGHVQVHPPGWRDDRSIDLTLDGLGAKLTEIRGDPQVEAAAPRVYAPALGALTEEGFMVMVVGVEPTAEAHPNGLLAREGLAGRLGQKRVLVGSALARKHGIGPGAELAVVGQDLDGSIANDLFTVADVISSPVDVVNSLGVVMSLSDAQDLLLMSDQAHEITIHGRDAERIGETAARLAALPSLRELEVLSWKEISPHFAGLVAIMDAYSLIILVIVFIAAAAGIANTMLMSTFERVHELGMLLALGCKPSRLSRIITLEAVILGLIGVGIGTVLGVGLVLMTMGSGVEYAALGGSDQGFEVAYQGLKITSHVYPRISVSNVVSGVVAVLLTSLLAVVWPVLYLVRLEPMEALRS